MGYISGMIEELQTWAADHGWGQYPLPRSRPPSHIGLRLVVGTLSLFGLIVMVPIVVVGAMLLFVMIRAAISG